MVLQLCSLCIVLSCFKVTGLAQALGFSWFITFDVQLLEKSPQRQPRVNGSHTNPRSLVTESSWDGKPGQDAVSCLFWSAALMWTRGHACWGPCAWVLWDSSNWALCLLPTSDLGILFPWLLFLGWLSGTPRAPRGTWVGGEDLEPYIIWRPLSTPSGLPFFHFWLLQVQIKPIPAPPGGRLTMLGDRLDLKGDLFLLRGVVGCWVLLWACLNSREPPNWQPPLLKSIIYFPDILSFHQTCPKCFGLPYFYDPSSKKGSVESGSAWFISEEKGWRVFLSLVSGIGISSYHPVSFALGF